MFYHRSMDYIAKYFKSLTELQKSQFDKLQDLYSDWNLKINVVSRKDIDQLYLRHVLHSLGIAKVINFEANSKVLDVGTGGGFPGIPLAILFPETQFHLVDSIAKKIKVVDQVVEGLNLKNIKTFCNRAEQITDKYDFVVNRAVAPMETFVRWVKDLIDKKQRHDLNNGIICLKGGDLTQELNNFPLAKIYDLSLFFDEPFFETKKVVHVPL